MKRTPAFRVLIVSCAMCSAVYADYTVENKGTWPETWPKELEPLRKQSRTLVGAEINVVFYEIPFTKREEFESAWPHLLKIKSKKAPVVLVRGPDKKLGTPINAGVRIKISPTEKGNRIELVVDGGIVDLNRIPLPADTPIIDERFEGGKNKTP